MIEPKAKIERFFQESLKHQASDLHLVVGLPPYLRIDGQLRPLPEEKPLTVKELEAMVFSVCSQEQREAIITNLELDFSFDYQDKARFRINAYHQKGTLAAAFRLIPRGIKTIEELSLPSICHEFTKLKQGFVLIFALMLS